jgi:hypothetical protein
MIGAMRAEKLTARRVEPEPMTDVQFTAAITHGGDWYVARCLQVGATSQGEAVESALANLREAPRTVL